MSWAPNLSPYVVFWRGEWRPVTFLSQGQREVFEPAHASAAVLYVGPDEWVAVAILPVDIHRRQDRTDNFLTIDDDESLTSPKPPLLSS